jgi:RNA ligase (TIGR02306 family)
MTVYKNDGDFGVCSRNLNLKETEGNSFWDMANKLNLRDKLMAIGKNIAIQGELIGEGIQGNHEGIKGQDFYVFDIWDIDNRRYCTPDERRDILAQIPGIKEVPVTEKAIAIFQVYDTVDKLLAHADGPSLKAAIREGLVYKSCNLINGETVSFKAISNKFLLKKGD